MSNTYPYYPILMNIREQACLVIGGGRVAFRKIKSLLQAGAHVTVISPEAVSEVIKMAENGSITFQPRSYQSGDMAGFRLVFAATDNRAVNEACRNEAEERGILLNVVDVPDLCNFIMPAVHRQGDLMLMASSQGSSPMMAKRIRREFQERYGPEYAVVTSIMGEFRLKAFTDLPDISHRKALFHYLVEEGPVDEALKLPESDARQLLKTAYEQYVTMKHKEVSK